MTEIELFSFLKETWGDLIQSSDQYAVYDCYSIASNIYVELKCRRTHYDELLIEESKFDRLLRAAADKEMIPIYICSTPKGIWGFNLANADLAWINQEMPASTDFENTKKITKSVAYLDTRQGLRLA
jgi:hypothetical protein